MLELEKMEKYDPKIYGSLKAEFLNSLDRISHVTVSDGTNENLQNQEKMRQDLIKDIAEGKFTINK